MYSNKENINILTALLPKHGIRHAVVCPGSRNAPIVHNLNECGDIRCYAVTDERSAGFYALGIAQATGTPVAVCVTSGSAVLNLMPAVAEAFYQHVPLAVISADRPSAWIDQQDGQTIRQPDVLGYMARKAVNLPEPRDGTERWHCNRLANEALLAMTQDGGGPVHINVPISEPLFGFHNGELPEERAISVVRKTTDTAALCGKALCRMFWAKRPMIVIGQLPEETARWLPLKEISRYAVVLSEPLSVASDAAYFDDVIGTSGGDRRDYEPDYILYIGGTLVSKRLKMFLRGCRDAESWVVNGDGAVTDTFMNLTGIIEGSGTDVLRHITGCIGKGEWRYDDYGIEKVCRLVEGNEFVERWRRALSRAAETAAREEPQTREAAVVKEFEKQLSGKADGDFAVHYANSTAVRLGCRYAGHHIFCNRGVNGIEGCLSTAAGFSLHRNMTFCVIGDLSFFYDQNALWNRELNGDLHILLLNNGCGGIFHKLEGLPESPAFGKFIAAGHSTTAEGICRQNGIEYIAVSGMAGIRKQMERFVGYHGTRPVLLEVFL